MPSKSSFHFTICVIKFLTADWFTWCDEHQRLQMVERQSYPVRFDSYYFETCERLKWKTACSNKTYFS